MRVLLVAQQLRRAVPGGIGTYLRGLVTGLAQLDDPPHVTVLASRGPELVLGAEVDAVTSSLPGPLLTRAWDAGLVRAPEGFDVVHAPALAFPPTAGTPLVVAVHDFAWRQVPEAFPARGRRWHDAALRRAVRRGATFVTSSEETAARLGPRARVLDPMYGADHLPPADPDATADLLARLDVRGPYLLAVGTLEPRKNLDRLVAAFVQARPRLPDLWPLVVVGPDGWGERLAPTPGVVMAGAVAPPVLAGLYAGARCLAYVPVHEGWGLPVVEAMAACTPVVSAPLPSAGTAALAVEPTDVDAIADALVVAASDDRRRAELVTAGLLRAAELTWAAAARRHLEVWASVRA